MKMQYEEKFGADDRSALEERIIAHFDGSLDNASSKSLLDEVMASPEKRALFRAHETLNSVIAATRVPMEAPLETRREIADRIPGLIAFLPGLLGTAETMPILQQSANPFLSFFARMSLQTAVSIGSAIAILTTAGIIVKNNLDNNAAQPPKIAVIQNAAPANSTSQSYGMIPSQSQNTAAANHENASSNLVKHTSSNVRTNIIPGSSFASTNDMSASDDAASQDRSTSDDRSSSDKASTSEESQPLVSNAFDAPKSVPAKVADIPVMQPQILMPTEDEVSQEITVRPYASYGERRVQLNSVGNAGTNVLYKPNTILGIEFEIGDRYAFRVQGGQSSFAQVGYTQDLGARLVSTIPGLKAYQSATFAQQANWTTVGMSYSIPVTSSIPIIFSADGGAVFGSRFSGVGITGIFGAAADFPISSTFTLRPLLTYDIVSSSTTPVSTPTGRVILENSISQTSMLSSAFGFQINLMYRF
jgi:hypothetical protein